MDKEQMIHYGLIEEAIEQRYSTNSRREKRPAQKEYSKIVEIILGVENNFHHNLFVESDEYTYQEIYEFYHNQYVNNVMYIITKIKPKFWALDKAAFSRKFRPQE
jgi:hypothetical protein